MAVCIVPFEKLYTILRKKEPTKQEMCNFFLQSVQKKIFKILNMFGNNIKFTREAC